MGVYFYKQQEDKMKIIYFTTASEKEDFNSFQENWTSSLNSFIQNLHNRLIRSLAITHEVEVISIRPFSRRYCKLKKLPASTTSEGKITWHYLAIKRSKLFRYHSAKRQAKKILAKMNLKDCVVLTDTLNPYLLMASKKLAKKFDLPIIGICNNSPSGITNTRRSYTLLLHLLADNLSGYITLTSGLNELFNKYNRANLTFEGIVENKFKKQDVSEYGKYAFFFGNLEEKFGVNELIKAFIEYDNKDTNLVIAGYHGNSDKINKLIKDHSNIKYLGMISNDLALSLENGSLFNINPRPYSEDYDRYLIPWNVLDYLNSNSLTVSVRNSKLKNYFEEDVIWLNSNEKEDFITGFNKALSIKGDEREQMIKKATINVNKLYSMEVVNRKVILFLKQFLKQRD